MPILFRKGAEVDDQCTLAMDNMKNLHDHINHDPIQYMSRWRLIVLNICNIIAWTFFAYTMISLTSTPEGTGDSIVFTVSVLLRYNGYKA